MMKLPISEKKYNHPLLLSLLVLNFSCTKPVDFVSPAKTQIFVDASQIPDIVDVSELIEEINIITLIEAEDALVGEVEKVLLTNDHFILLDLFSSNRIVAFDKHGNFVKDIISKGEGPEELMNIRDAWLNEKNNLEVYDRGLQKVLVFDENFEVVETIHIKDPNYYISLAKIPHRNGYVGFMGYYGIHDDGMYHKLAILDSMMNPVNLAFPYDNSLYSALVTVLLNPFFVIDDTIRFSQDLDPFIYSIASTGEVSKEFELVIPTIPFLEILKTN